MQQEIRISAGTLRSEFAATEKNYWDGGVVSVGAVAGDSVGLAPGATVSVFRSQAARIPTAKTKQMHFFMVLFVTDALVGVKLFRSVVENSEDRQIFSAWQVARGTDFRSVSEECETLAELMLHAEQFCSKVEEATKDVAPIVEYSELRIKIGQIRNQLAELQEIFNDGKLSIENARVRADFRQMVIALLWVAFYARSAIDFKTFRMLVRIEAIFTYLLLSRGSGATQP